MTRIGYVVHVTIDGIGMMLLRAGIALAILGEALICDDLKAALRARKDTEA